MRFSRCQRVSCGRSSRPWRWAPRSPRRRSAEAAALEARRVPALFASAQNVFTTNRVQCRVFSTGQICATGSSTVGGGIWPRGTADQYVFGSGINIAGIIERRRQVGERVRGRHRRRLLQQHGRRRQRRSRSGRSSRRPTRPTRPSGRTRRGCRARSAPRPRHCVDLALGSDPQGDLFDPPLQGWHRRVAGRPLVPQLGGQPGPPREPRPPARHRGRDPGAGLELPQRQRGHHLLPLHLLQRHQHQPGRLRGGPARRMRRGPAAEGRGLPGAQHRQVRHQPPGRRLHHQQPVRRVRGGHGRGPGRRQLRHVNVPFALGYTYEHTLQRAAARASAGPSTRPSSARRRSSPARASWA